MPSVIPKSRTSALAITSLVLGLLGFVLLLPAPGGLICAILAWVRIRKSNGLLTGAGLAVAGLIVSALSVATSTALIIYLSKHESRASSESAAAKSQTLAEARAGFVTELTRRERTGFPVAEPPADVLTTVRYRSTAGELAAYLSVVPDDGKKHPAIIWLAGGFSNSIGDSAWEDADETNDQSARFFRQAGVVTLYPSLRGGNENPGYRETCFGEVDDVLAAADYLASHPRIDPERIYLGGHSTGGTLALLVAESSSRFRAVFAFGPIARVHDYGAKWMTFNLSNSREKELRSPVKWLHAIRTPTFVLEGVDGNIDSLRTLKSASKNPLIEFYEVSGKDHFDILAPYSRAIAEQIMQDTGPDPVFRF